MKNTKRQAFTIVELVIVIAVIAILSAVLIPTFGAIIKDANIAADQSAAATLTTELHVYLKGETIDSEEELMDVLSDEKSGIGKKLVPKALAYEYHFWFDMATQMIISAHTDDIKPDENEGNEEVTASAPAGAQLMSATLTAETAKTYPKSMRHVYGNGYFLVDYNLLNIFCNLDEIDSTNYASYLDKFDASKADYALEDYAEIAEHVLETLKTTVIVNENGTFYYSETTEDATYYFTSGLKVVSSDVYTNSGDVDKLPTPINGELKLPESVLLVEEGALNFATETKIPMASEDAVIDVFTPNSTNAVIVVGTEEYVITNKACGTEGCTNSTCDILAKNDADKTYVRHLIFRNPNEDYKIGFVESGDISNEITGMIFVAYKNGELQLTGVDYKSGALIDKVEEWKILDEGKHGVFAEGFGIDADGKIDLTKADVNSDNVCQFVVQATANTLYEKNVKRTITVVVVKPVDGTATIAPATANQKFYLDKNGSVVLSFSEKTTSYETKATIPYSYYYDSTGVLCYAQNILKTTPVIELKDSAGNVVSNFTFTHTETVEGDNPHLLYSLSYTAKDADGDGTLDHEATSFNLYVDGCLETPLSAAMTNSEDVLFSAKYHHEANDKRPYYVGSGKRDDGYTITLGDLFEAKSIFSANGQTATLEIYDSKDYTANESTEDTFSVKINNEAIDTATIKHDTWKNTTLEFIFDSSDTTSTEQVITIKITPDIEGGVTFPVQFTVVRDAVNIITPAQLANNNSEHTTDIVLQADVEMITSHKVILGDQTLYGNGYIINATKYVATEATGVSTVYTKQISIKCEITDCSLTNSHYGKCSACRNIIATEAEAESHECYTCERCDATDKHTHKQYYVTGQDKYYCTLNENIVITPHTMKTVVTYSSPTNLDYSNTDFYIFNDYLISVNGGAVDNIYLNGPVYPDFQYELDYYKSNDGSNIGYTSTAYYVSGILSAGTSKITNSYISGFRQPVKAEGTMLTIDNSTLHGGNYANLALADGTLTLKDLTTIQDQNGTLDTINGTKYVLGLGIVVEQTALRTSGFRDADGKKVNLTVEEYPIRLQGYLNQYNWVAKNQTASLPTVMGIDFTNVFPNLYNTDVFSTMESYLHSANNTQYVNAGIMMFILNPEEFDDNLEAPYKNIFTSTYSNGDLISGYSWSNNASYAYDNFKISDNRTGGTDEFAKRTYAFSVMPTFRYKVAEIKAASGILGGLTSGVLEGIISGMGVDLDEMDVQICLFLPQVSSDITLGTTGYPINVPTTHYYYNYGK